MSQPDPSAVIDRTIERAPALAATTDDVTSTMPPPAVPPDDCNIVVPGYEILGVLGRGGMGVVYRARHIQLERTVALKMILSGGQAGAADLQRFRTEAESVARLQHPHIVQIYEVGEREGGQYFSLEFCSGGSLDKKLAGTPLPSSEAARLVEMLARAVEHAHRHGVIHRQGSRRCDQLGRLQSRWPERRQRLRGQDHQGLGSAAHSGPTALKAPGRHVHTVGTYGSCLGVSGVAVIGGEEGEVGVPKNASRAC